MIMAGQPTFAPAAKRAECLRKYDAGKYVAVAKNHFSAASFYRQVNRDGLVKVFLVTSAMYGPFVTRSATFLPPIHC